MAKTVRLIGPTQRAYACKLVNDAPDGFVMKLGEETRRDAQNRKLHAQIGDIQKMPSGVQVPDMTQLSVEDCKLIFMNALRNEMRFLPELEGNGQFLVGQRTSTLSVPQFAVLVELVYAWGAKYGVMWSEPDNA